MHDYRLIEVGLESGYSAEVYTDKGFLMFVAHVEPDGGTALGATLSRWSMRHRLGLELFRLIHGLFVYMRYGTNEV